jgi:hypothetical protein
VKVKNGVLHGEIGTGGAADWYELNGTIAADGAATIRANGITGSQSTHQAIRTLVYHLNIKWSPTSITGAELVTRLGIHLPRMLPGSVSIPSLKISWLEIGEGPEY